MRKLHGILCPIDFSDFSLNAYRYALSVACRYGARLFALHIVELWKYPYADFAAVAGGYGEFFRVVRQGSEEQLKKFVKICSKDDVQPELIVEQGIAPDCILALADAREADLIVMGTHGRRGFDRLMLGSVTERVMRKAPCPLLVVNSPSQDFNDSTAQTDPVRLRRIVFCTDFSENSRQALDHAISLRTEYDAELTVLHVVEDFHDSAKKDLAISAAMGQFEDILPDRARKTGQIKMIVRVGKAYEQIVQFALEAGTDLVVMAVRGRGTLDLAIFGSTTHRVIQLAPCPVFVVHV